MAKKQKVHLLTLDERIRMRNEGIRRPGRVLKRLYKGTKLVKEETVLVSARLAKSAYLAFTDAYGYEPGVASSPLSQLISAALIDSLVLKGYSAKSFRVACSDFNYSQLKPILSKFRKTRASRDFPKESTSYSVSKSREKDGTWTILITLPKVRGGKIGDRIALIRTFILAADRGFSAWDGDIHSRSQTQSTRVARKGPIKFSRPRGV